MDTPLHIANTKKRHSSSGSMAVAWCRRHWVAAEVMAEAPRLASRQPALHRHVVDEATEWRTQHGPHDVRPKAVARARDSNPEGVRGGEV